MKVLNTRSLTITPRFTNWQFNRSAVKSFCNKCKWLIKNQKEPLKNDIFHGRGIKNKLISMHETEKLPNDFLLRVLPHVRKLTRHINTGSFLHVINRFPSYHKIFSLFVTSSYFDILRKNVQFLRHIHTDPRADVCWHQIINLYAQTLSLLHFWNSSLA